VGFLRELVAYWRSPENKWLKVFVYIGVIVHISVLVSVRTGLWDEYFFRTTNNKLIQACDFFAIYYAGHEVLEGDTIYSSMDDNLDYLEVIPYYYPFRYLPASASVGVVLNLFKPWVAYKLWILLSEILFLSCMAALAYHFKTMRQIHIAVAMYLLFIPFYAELFLGQFNQLQTTMILGMILAASGWHIGSVRGWWSASVLWKHNTAICLPAIIRWKSWKPLAWLALVVIITSGPYFLMHPEDVAKFFYTNVTIPGRPDLAEKGIGFKFAGLDSAGNISVQSLVALAAKVDLGNRKSQINPIYNFISILMFVGVGIWATIKAKQEMFAESICMWVAVYFMIYTNVWEYHYLMLLPVVTYLYLKHPSKWLIAAWVLLVIPPRHLGYASLLPNWDIPWIRPVAAVIIFIYCLNLLLGPFKPPAIFKKPRLASLLSLKH
jgi:hypothetical protein